MNAYLVSCFHTGVGRASLAISSPDCECKEGSDWYSLKPEFQSSILSLAHRGGRSYLLTPGIGRWGLKMPWQPFKWEVTKYLLFWLRPNILLSDLLGPPAKGWLSPGVQSSICQEGTWANSKVLCESTGYLVTVNTWGGSAEAGDQSTELWEGNLFCIKLLCRQRSLLGRRSKLTHTVNILWNEWIYKYQTFVYSHFSYFYTYTQCGSYTYVFPSGASWENTISPRKMFPSSVWIL